MTSPNTTDLKKPLIIERVYDAPRALVYKAWTDPKHVAEWWGPHGFTNPVVNFDVRPGGTMYIAMTAPDGTVYPNKGVFLEVVEPERLVFTGSAFQDENGGSLMEDRTTVTFIDLGEQTKVILEAVVTKLVDNPDVLAAVAGMGEGWGESLDRLETFLQG